MRSVLSILSLVFAAPILFAGQVFIVDGSGGGDFVAIQPAIDAASDGDTVLVETGSYASFAVANKALSIVGDTGRDVQITGQVRAYNLAAGKALVLANLQVTGAASRALSLTNNAGSVRIEYCSFAGANAPACTLSGPFDGWDAVRVAASADVSIVSTDVLGGASGTDEVSGELGYGGTGLFASSGSKIALYNCSQAFGTTPRFIRGGGGTYCATAKADGTHGGTGIRISSAECFAASCDVNGGSGANTPVCLSYGGNGGSGMLVSSNSIAHVLQCGLHAGGPGCGVCGFDPCGDYGTAYAGPIDFLAGPSRSLIAQDRVPRENATVDLHFWGQSGDEVDLYVSRRTSRRYIPAYRGVLLTQITSPAIHLGTIPPGQAHLVVPYSFPELGSGIESRVYHLQAIHRNTQGQLTLGTPISLVVVDQAF